jgi:phenylacetate-coenzyme A ligase PaaK-like adenylate-forming protein
VDLSVWPPRCEPAYRPADGAEHWLPEVECAEPAAREELIFQKLTHQVRWAWERSPFYRRKWQEAGVSPGTLKSLDDLAAFPGRTWSTPRSATPRPSSRSRPAPRARRSTATSSARASP